MPESLTLPLLSLCLLHKDHVLGRGVGPREKRRQGGASRGFVTGIIYLCPPRPTPVHGQSLGVHFTWEFPDCNLESDRAQVQTKFYDFKE